MDAKSTTDTSNDIDTAAVAKVIDHFERTRDAWSVDVIAEETGLMKPDAKAALDALKAAAIVKTSGRGKYQKWYIDPELAIPVELPEYLRPLADTENEPGTAGQDGEKVEAGQESAGDTAGGGNDADSDDNVLSEPGVEGIDEAETAAAETDTESGTGSENLGDDPADIDTAEPETADIDLAEDADSAADADEDGTTPEGVSASTIEPAAGRSTGIVDTELAFPFHMLPVAEAAEGATVGDLYRLTGMSTTRILKALWGMRQIGAADSTAPFHPSRGEWRRNPGAVLEQLTVIRMTDMPPRVTCPDCGHEAALRYNADAQQQTVATFDPEAPAPEGLFERDTYAREPQIMFCAMVLCGLGDAVPVELATETGYDEATVLRSLWALRACRLVECTEVQRPTGGRWRATESTIDGAPYAHLTDAPDALGCATCGHSLGARSGNGGKATAGVSRERTGDGGKPLPDGSLDAMIKAWAAAVVRGDCAEEQVTCAGLRRLLSDQADAGVLQTWLEAWAEANPADPHARLAGAITTSLAAGNRPRSASAVKNALERIGKQKFSPILRVAGPVLTFRAKTSRTT